MAEIMTALYANARALKAAHDTYIENSPKHLQLRNALRPAIWKKWWAELHHAPWKKECIPDLFSYSTTPVSQDMETFFCSSLFRDRLFLLTGKKVNQLHVQLLAFSHGDYLLLHDTLKQPSGTIFFLELTQKWQHLWGGFTSFVKQQELIRLYPVPNSLTIFQQENNVNYFVKYVNFYAKNNKRIVLQGTCNTSVQ